MMTGSESFTLDAESAAVERERFAALMAAAKRTAQRIPQVKVAKGLLGPLFPSREERRCKDGDS